MLRIKEKLINNSISYCYNDTTKTLFTNPITVPLLDEMTKIQFCCSVTKRNQKYINLLLQKSSNHNV